MPDIHRAKPPVPTVWGLALLQALRGMGERFPNTHHESECALTLEFSITSAFSRLMGWFHCEEYSCQHCDGADGNVARPEAISIVLT